MSNNIYFKTKQHADQPSVQTALIQMLADNKNISVSYKQLFEHAKLNKYALNKHFVDEIIVPLFLKRSIDCIALMIGASGAGKAFSCLNNKQKWPQVRSILTDLNSNKIFVDTAALLSFKPFIEQGEIASDITMYYVPEKDVNPALKKAIDNLKQKITIHDWTPLDDGADDDIEPNYAKNPEHIGSCLFTSGSTAKPKGVLISENDLISRANAEIKWYNLSHTDILLNILPYSFDVGLNQLLSSLTVGCTLVLQNSWLPQDIFNTVKEYRISGISGVPSIWKDTINSKLKFDKGGPHASLRYITVSGGDLSEMHLHDLAECAGDVGIIKTYGQTETFRTSCLLPNNYKNKIKSVGSAFENVKCYIVRKDLSLCEPCEPGQVIHTGLGTMIGYIDKLQTNEKIKENPFYGPDDKSKFAVFTGDIGYLDEDGFLFLMGRQDSMIKINDNRFYPREINECLLKEDSIKDAEVIVVNENDDKLLIAFLIPRSGDEIAIGKIRKNLAQRLPSYMVPGRFITLREMPKTESGKPDYPLLINFAKENIKSGAI